MEGRLINRTTNCVLAPRAEIAQSGWRLLRGLIGQRFVPADYALGLSGCDWVHTWGMCVPLDLLFCGSNGTVLRVLREIAPCRVAPCVRGASVVWEMTAGGFAPERVAPGDEVVFE